MESLVSVLMHNWISHARPLSRTGIRAIFHYVFWAVFWFVISAQNLSNKCQDGHFSTSLTDRYEKLYNRGDQNAKMPWNSQCSFFRVFALLWSSETFPLCCKITKKPWGVMISPPPPPKKNGVQSTMLYWVINIFWILCSNIYIYFL